MNGSEFMNLCLLVGIFLNLKWKIKHNNTQPLLYQKITFKILLLEAIDWKCSFCRTDTTAHTAKYLTNCWHCYNLARWPSALNFTVWNQIILQGKFTKMNSGFICPQDSIYNRFSVSNITGEGLRNFICKSGLWF